MAGNFLHFLAESIHHFFIEQSVLHILDRIDQIDRWTLDNHQQAGEPLCDFAQPVGWDAPDFTDFSN